MAQISKYPISEKIYQRCWELFQRTLINVNSVNDAQIIITDLFTPTERIVFMKRLAIAFLLIQKYGYKEIRTLLKVSFPTIAMVSRSLMDGSSGYTKAMERILKEENFQEFLNQLGQKIVALPAQTGKGSGGYRYLKQKLENSSKTHKPF